MKKIMPQSVSVGIIGTSGDAFTVVGSEAVSLPVFTSPPPDTVATLVIPDDALFATFTVTVMAG